MNFFSKKEESQPELTEELKLVKEILENTQSNIRRALDILKDSTVDTEALLHSLQDAKSASEQLIPTTVAVTENEEVRSNGDRIIEGVFNGEKMVGGDGVEYNVPANYASKSKLLEGDILKLTITKDGSFIYKQIGPVDRKQLVTRLARDTETGDWFALMDNNRWRLLTASVTYFHGEPGDDVVILIPTEGRTRWAAVENVIKRSI